MTINTSQIKNIVVEEYKDIYQPNGHFGHCIISPEQIEQIDDASKTTRTYFIRKKIYIYRRNFRRLKNSKNFENNENKGKIS